MTVKKVVYTSNNSGGEWWLSDKHWENLERAGWEVEWLADRFLGAQATSAIRYGLDLKSAVDEWEHAAKQSSISVGCLCCGPPHHFEYYEDDKFISSGPKMDFECSW